MKIKLIDFGVPEHQRPYRPHGNDAGADVYLPYDCTLQPGEIAKIPLGFGLEIPDGYAGYIFPRTSMAVKGLVCALPEAGTMRPAMPRPRDCGMYCSSAPPLISGNISSASGYAGEIQMKQGSCC